jgi:GAF domain-containing protein
MSRSSRQGQPRPSLPAAPRGLPTAGDTATAVARAFADIALTFYAQPSVEATVDTILHYAVTVLDGCDRAGISLARRGGRIQTVAGTDDTALLLDELQYILREGPSLDAIRQQQSLLTLDLARDYRWPRYGPHAVAAGARSMLSFCLFTEQQTHGVLNLYADRAHAFSRTTERLGPIFASHAAIALAAARTRDQLRQAIRGRQVIGEALGVLKEREGLTSEQAFEVLRTASQRLNIKVRELAAHVACTGEHPADVQGLQASDRRVGRRAAAVRSG